MKLFAVLSFISFSSVVFASVPKDAKVCVFEAAQTSTWSTSCDGQLMDYGSYDSQNRDPGKRITNEMAISLHLSEIIDAGYSLKACTGFPNSYGARCILTK